MKSVAAIDETYAQRLWRLFKRDRFAFTGFCIVIVFFILAALAPFLANDHAIVRVADGRLSFPVFRSLEPIEWRFLLYVPLAGVGLCVSRTAFSANGTRSRNRGRPLSSSSKLLCSLAIPSTM